MIIAVNGKSVGGMTKTGVEIELDLCGPDMTLIVSRYKFASKIQNEMVQIEQSYITALDSALNDHRQVGWIDFGSVVPTIEGSLKISQDVGALPPADSDSDSMQCSVLGIDDSMDDEQDKRYRTTQKSCIDTAAVSSSENQFHKKDKTEKAFIPFLRKIDSGNDVVNQAKTPLQNEEQVKKHDSMSTSNGKCNVAAESNDRESQRSIDSNEEDSDDGNAWCGCVCGCTHQRETKKHPEIFWIQCDICASWYDCSSTCVGFTKCHAETMSSWTCWGCLPSEGSPSATKIVAETTLERLGRVSVSPMPSELIAPTSEAIADTTTGKMAHFHMSSIATVEGIAPTTSSDASESSMPKVQAGKEQNEVTLFGVNDLVFVREHAWARVNHPEGIAKILKAYKDGSGNHVYDVRYVVGGRANGVLPKFLVPHCFQ
jgi:hypothetical protein